MNLNFSNTEYIVVTIALAAILLTGIFGWWNAQRHKAATAGLRERFGTEYDRAVEMHGSERKGQATLLDREKRVEKFNLHDLEPGERERFLEQWKAAQSHFVDSPKEAVTEADTLVCSLMQARGYPVSDFERRAADISVDHPQVMENYRAAHAIALKVGDSGTSTEELRTAMVHYHTLFEELLQVQAVDKKAAA
jgi:hypothetical protein